MSGLYPTLEDLTVDEAARAQVDAGQEMMQQQHHQQQLPYYSTNTLSTSTASNSSNPTISSSPYGDILQEICATDYLGLDVSDQAIVQYTCPQSSSSSSSKALVQSLPGSQAIASVTPKGDKNMALAQIKQGVHKVVLAKDQRGKLGVAVKSIDKGVFVSFVWSNSAASMAGVRFGDQILQIDGQDVAGLSDGKALKLLKNAGNERVEIAMRDRPWCRTLTVVKDSTNHCGFTFKNGNIERLVLGSSAARNGLLINHRLIEINGRNVVGMPDAKILEVIKKSPPSITLTIMPTYIYKHLVKKIGSSTIKKYMDHTVPEL
eukprot:m.239738 g.239738  ORF g.239738 m.239738 type:complete len:319 (+) comp14008_c0_seq1:90-1046(+)